MENIYTTLHPETGEPTKETEFVNSWKWNDTRKGFDSYSEQQRALINKYSLPEETPVAAAELIIQLKEQVQRYHREWGLESRKNEELLQTLEIASFKEKDLIKKGKEAKKKLKNFLTLIQPYLHHNEDCLVTTMKIVGRARTKSKCNCGLSKISSMKI